MSTPDLFAHPFSQSPRESRERGARQGRQRADSGIERVSRHDTLWVEKARLLARQAASEKGRVTSDDLHELLALPDGAHPNLMGAVWRGIGLPVLGYETSRRPEAHGRVIRVYGPPP